MDNYKKSIIVSFLSVIFYSLPFALFKTNHWNYKLLDIFYELSLVLLCTSLLYYIIFSIKYLGQILFPLLFAIGAASNYYIFTLNKPFDYGVLINILSIEQDLIIEYLSWKLILFCSLSAIIGYLIATKIVFFTAWLSNKNIYLTMFLIILSWVSFARYNFNFQTIQYINREYHPYNIFYNLHYFFYKYLPHIKSSKAKLDPSLEYNFSYVAKGKEPLIIVLIIGESMRGDIISLNGYNEYDNMPLLSKRKNLISFPNAVASSTMTRISIPYMLTRAIPHNFDHAMSEKSVISILRNLGFRTSWIGNQGLFGAWETTFASHALESEFQITKIDLQNFLKKSNIYDEDLLFFLDQRLKETENNNHFIVLHLLGSHWNIGSRYKEQYKKFLPICNSSSPDACDKRHLLNSYHNSILYTDNVVNNIIAKLEQKNSFLLYASDHGFSLGENGIFGNAYEGANIPKEQLSIAMFTWASDKFLNYNNPKYQKIYKNKTLPVSHDYIIHSLLDCLSIKSEFIIQDYSICK